jgi:hypothetical protein
MPHLPSRLDGLINSALGLCGPTPQSGGSAMSLRMSLLVPFSPLRL